MKHIYIMILVTIMIGLGGCTGASEMNSSYPKITLQGAKNITLKVGQLINEPGYSASDVQDGDLTNQVEVTSNLDYYHVGEYYVNYSVTDSDGHTATASRTITITQNGADSGQYSGDYQYGDIGSVYYDFATYNYNYLVREEGKSITEDFYAYDTNGNQTITNVIFEKNKNDGSLYEYDNNQISNRDYIEIDQIRSVDNNADFTIYQRNIRTGEVLAQKSQENMTMTCTLQEHLGSINTQNITGANILNFDYIDVLHVRCSRSDGVVFDTYFANGWGEVLTIIHYTNSMEAYEVLDKNSMGEI